MTTTIDASGVEVMDGTVVAVRVLSPRAAWSRMKVRVLAALRAVRARAAERQAAIAQFVKPYWEKIPAGVPGLALLATLAHRPAYRWVMRQAQGATTFAGRVARTGLSWFGRSVRWLGHAVASTVGVVSPANGDRLHAFVLRSSSRMTASFDKFCLSAAKGQQDFFNAATHPAATATMSKFAFPLALGVGVNMATQGLLAALASSIPVIGLPLAAVLGTGRGMVIAAGTIFLLGLADGYNARDKEVVSPTHEPAAAPVVVPPMGSEEQLVLADQQPEKVITTKTDSLADGTPVVTVQGTNDPEEIRQAVAQHVAQDEADSEAELHQLEAEMATAGRGAGKRPAQVHGPQGKGRRGGQETPAKKAAPGPSVSNG